MLLPSCLVCGVCVCCIKRHPFLCSPAAAPGPTPTCCFHTSCVQIQAAEERAEGLSLELQYAQGEAARLAAELELAREAAERRARSVPGACRLCWWVGRGCASLFAA